MNILPHKSWNVYNAKNREKVRKDEENARQKDETKAKRALEAERERRLALLRQRAQQRYGAVATSPETTSAPKRTSGDADDGNDDVVDLPSSTTVSTKEHINFWADFEAKLAKTTQPNPEYEAERKAKEEKWERSVTMYLDNVIKDAATPWYGRLNAVPNGMLDSPSTSSNSVATESVADPLPSSKHELNESERRDARQFKKFRDEKTKRAEDPLFHIKNKLEKRERKKKEVEAMASGLYQRHSDSRDKRNEKNHKKSSYKDEVVESSSIEQLRAQRLQRERNERDRAARLLGLASPSQQKQQEPEGYYSSQFNPEATRRARKASGRMHQERHSDRYRIERHKPYNV